jgi:hypothetical protein
VDSATALRVGEAFASVLLAPILQPMIGGSDELGSYELDLMAREVARDDRSGFAAIVAAQLRGVR